MVDNNDDTTYNNGDEENDESPFGAKVNIKPHLAPLYAQAHAVIPNWDNLMRLYTDFFAIVAELDFIRQQIAENLDLVVL